MRGVGQMHLEVPWESLFGPQLKNFVETICLEHFVFYREKYFVILRTLFSKNNHFQTILLDIFQTLSYEKYPFSDNFDQILFLVKSLKVFYKKCPKINF